MINDFDVFFPQLSNDKSSFKIFHFHLQKVQNIISQKGYFLGPLDRKLILFYVGKDIFQRVLEMFFVRNRICERAFEDKNGNFRKNYLHHCKDEEKIRRKSLSNNFFKYFLVS